jgi:hypothetical protein
MVLTTKPSAVNIVQTRSSKQNQTQSSFSSLHHIQIEANTPSSPVTVNASTSTSTVPSADIENISHFTNMAGTLRLEPFKGECGEDIEKFLRRFDQYCACMNFREGQAFAQLAWHLDGIARLYIENQSPAPTTLDELKELLVTKYSKEKPVSLNIFSMKQEVSENAEQFLSRLEAETFKTKINDDLQVQIALNGLHPSVSSAISTHGPKTLSEVRNLARRLTNVRHSAPVAAANNSFEDTVNILTAAVAQLTTVMTKQQQQPEPPSRNYSPHHRQQQTRRQPHFEKEREACPRCGGRCTSYKYCRAIGKTCDLCGLNNHFKSKCKTARKNYRVNSS